MTGQVRTCRGVALVLACPLAVAACQGPEVRARPLHPEVAAFDRLHMVLPGGDGPIDAEGLVLAAIENAPVRRRARADLAQAQAHVQLTETRRPFVYMSEVEYHTDGAPWTLGLSVERPFTREALQTARTDAAVAERIAAQWTLERVGWEVRDRILKALVRIEHARIEAGFAEEEVRLRTELEAMLRQGVTGGVARLTDAQLAAARAQQARLALDAVRSRTVEAETGLATALGIPRRSIRERAIRPSVGELLPAAVDPDRFDAALRWALVRRSDVLVAIAGYGAAEARLRITLAGLTPDLSLAPGILWDQKDFVLRLAGAMVPVPAITDAKVAIALSDRDAARLTFEEVQAQVLADAETAWTKLATANRESVSAAAEVAVATAEVHQVETAIRQRTLPTTAGPAGRLRLLAAQRAGAGAELRRQIAQLDLELAVERVFSEPPLPTGSRVTAGTHVRLALALSAAFLGGGAAVYGLERLAPGSVLAAVGLGGLPNAPAGMPWAESGGDDEEDEDDEAVASLQWDGPERILVLPPGVAEANGIVVADVRPGTWTERYTRLGTVLDVAPLLGDVADIRETERLVDQSEARLEPLRGRRERLRQAYDAGLVALTDVNLAERALQDEEMARAGHAAARRQTLQRVRHQWGSRFARAAADRAPLLEALAERRKVLVQVGLPAALREREFRVDIGSGAAARPAELIGPGFADVAGMGSGAVVLLTDGTGLRPGLRIEVSFAATDRTEPGVVLPTGAVLFHGDGIWAYRNLGDGRFGRRELHGLRRFERGWFVPEPVLEPDARIVIRGGQMLLAEEFRADIMREDDD